MEYDDTLNRQRETIYRKRRELLGGQDPKQEAFRLLEEELKDVINFHTAGDDESTWDIKEIYEVANSIFPLSESERLTLDKIQDEAGSNNEDKSSRTKLRGYLLRLAVQTYNRLEKALQDQAGSADAMQRIAKGVLLRSIDTLWIEHLEALQHLRTGIGLRGYGQRDPLVEYQREAFQLFKQLLAQIRKQVVYSIFKVGAATQLAPSALQLLQRNATFSAPAKTMPEHGSVIAQAAAATPQQKEAQRREAQDQSVQENAQTHFQGSRVGRNDPCPCGSGKKFKKCHGK